MGGVGVGGSADGLCGAGVVLDALEDGVRDGSAGSSLGDGREEGGGVLRDGWAVGFGPGS